MPDSSSSSNPLRDIDLISGSAGRYDRKSLSFGSRKIPIGIDVITAN